MPDGLLEEVKDYLNITWLDVRTENNITGMIKRGMSYLQKVAGVTSLDFTLDDTPKADFLIEEMDLSVRSLNCLKRANMNTLKDVAQAAEFGKLKHIRNLGRRSIEEILYKLKYFGYDYFYVYDMQCQRTS